MDSAEIVYATVEEIIGKTGKLSALPAESLTLWLKFTEESNSRIQFAFLTVYVILRFEGRYYTS